MIRVRVDDKNFNKAYFNALADFPRIDLERPKQFYQRWEETYSCRVRGDYVEFPNEETYTWFVLKYA